ncbi:cag pathogenicity island Cag12 family protein [Aliarcobacter butzleri]|uniref:cag pathogenicity island Cag12 family protein n=1 Tax=Aliarcobacter butzleri TaxID=28197 RepID=UPI001EDB83ED|nr:cag pathogenicity island Cag12 family protein [Aliarcobacter butzleri]MCG3667483.1 cag pathogenicity island Cag12 family protein [Aliarcobacter butzleri]MCG3703763.1 cag pathogenicity island Cag12 family protein [Aliarcobacter butzleri]MDN5112934.1 cag pathogenicity island Cag12 family protein [Aliarcobacter butzleri]
MKKKILLSLTALTILSFTGCSDKIPNAEPVKWHKDSALTINQEFLLTKEFKVPKDPTLQYQNWTFQATAQKQGIYLFRNEDVAKTFLVAHNSSEIIIIGRENLIKEYKNYFLANQVTANIKLQAVKPIKSDFDKVNILFFNNINE